MLLMLGVYISYIKYLYVWLVAVIIICMAINVQDESFLMLCLCGMAECHPQERGQVLETRYTVFSDGLGAGLQALCPKGLSD